MAKTKTKKSFDTRFRRGEKVTATVSLPGVPEGTTGTVKLVNGLTWTRYWVFFDNGVHLGQLSQPSLVRTKQWDEFRTARETAASAAPFAAPPPGDATADGAAPAAADTGSRIPAHLLERAKNRKKALGVD
jgi:hypothetical protein